MFCPNCGSEINDGAMFCPNCGFKKDSQINEEVVEEKKPILLIVLASIIMIVVIGIIIFFILQNINKKAGFITDKDGFTYYVDASGNRKYNQWIEYENEHYYVDSNGRMKTDAWVDNDYYLGSDGKMMRNAWVQDKSTGQWYYVGDDGKYIRNKLITIDGKEYYFNQDGTYIANLLFNIPDTDYMSYFNEDGSRNKAGDFVFIGDTYFYIDKDGKILMNSWIEKDGNWFYLNDLGKIVTNKWIDQTYYVDKDGKMLMNTVSPEGFKLNVDGKIDDAYKDALMNKLYPRRQQQNYVYTGSQEDVSQLSQKIQQSTIAKETIDFTDVESFDVVKFGSWEQDDNVSNGSESLQWIVLEKDAENHKALLWSKYIIDKPSSSNNVKSWLNSFYQTAFTQAEKNVILDNKFEVGGNAKVAIIGHNELIKYYFYDTSTETYYNCVTTATKYAKNKGVYSCTHGYAGEFFNNLTGDFLFHSGCSRPSVSKVGVRPLIWVTYTGTSSSKKTYEDTSTIPPAKDEDSGITAKLGKGTVISEEYDYDDSKTVSIKITPPVLKTGSTNNQNIANKNIGYAMDELMRECEEFIDEASTAPKSIIFNVNTMQSFTSTDLTIKMEGTVTYRNSSNTTKLYYLLNIELDEDNYSLTKY